jgi:hypothetical protein
MVVLPIPEKINNQAKRFFVFTTAAGPAILDFNATDKTVAQNAIGTFSTPQNIPVIDLSLYRI